jgi:hypothetical protein
MGHGEPILRRPHIRATHCRQVIGASMQCVQPTTEAMEDAVGRPLVWATGHFLGLTGSEGALDIEVDVVPDGRQLTHASTSV